MTMFGKLLVFLNFLFAAITGALIVFVFSTRANWVTAYKHAETQAKSAEAAFKTERASHENDLKQNEARVAALQAEVSRLTNAVTSAQAEAQSNRDLATKNEGLNLADKTAQSKVQAELAQIQKERDILVQQQSELRNRVVSIQQELDKQRGVAVLADLDKRNMEQKANNLLRQLEELTGRVRELESQALSGGASTGRVAADTGKAPPPGVRGKVTRAEGGFGVVDIGSDSGVSAGNKLTVFRGNNYLGDLVITEVHPKRAVGRFEPARRGLNIQKDDQVTTGFTGTPMQ
jgi:hypothetical protein